MFVSVNLPLFAGLSFTVVAWRIPKKVNVKLEEMWAFLASKITIALTVYVWRSAMSFLVKTKS